MPFLKTLWNDWPARMTGPLSLILLFVPILAPQFTAKYLGGTTLVWLVCFLCLIVAAYRAWLLEHRARIAEKLDPLIEDANLLRQLWDKIQYDHRESQLIRFPLAGFDVKEWEEVHKQRCGCSSGRTFRRIGSSGDSRKSASRNNPGCLRS